MTAPDDAALPIAVALPWIIIKNLRRCALRWERLWRRRRRAISSGGGVNSGAASGSSGTCGALRGRREPSPYRRPPIPRLPLPLEIGNRTPAFAVASAICAGRRGAGRLSREARPRPESANSPRARRSEGRPDAAAAIQLSGDQAGRL